MVSEICRHCAGAGKVYSFTKSCGPLLVIHRRLFDMIDDHVINHDLGSFQTEPQLLQSAENARRRAIFETAGRRNRM